MPVKITCPHCGVKNALTEPLPLPGSQIQCVDCVARLAISYPPGVQEALTRRGKTFQDRVTGATPPKPARRTTVNPRRSGWLGFMGADDDADDDDESPVTDALSAEDVAAIEGARSDAHAAHRAAGAAQRRILSSLDAAQRMAGDEPSERTAALVATLMGLVDDAGSATEAAAASVQQADRAASPQEAIQARDGAQTAATRAETDQLTAQQTVDSLRSIVREQQAHSEQAERDDTERRAEQAHRAEQQRIETEQALAAEQARKEAEARAAHDAQQAAENARKEAEARAAQATREREAREREQTRARLDAALADAITAAQAARAAAERAAAITPDAADPDDETLASPALSLALEQLRAAQADAQRAADSIDASTLTADNDTEASAIVRAADLARLTAESAAERAESASRSMVAARHAARAEHTRKREALERAVQAARDACATLDETAATVETAVTDGRRLSRDVDGPAVRQALQQLVRSGTRISQAHDRAHEALQRAEAATDATTARQAADDVRRELYGAEAAADTVSDAAESLTEAVDAVRRDASVAQQARAARIGAVVARVMDAVAMARTHSGQLDALVVRVVNDADATGEMTSLAQRMHAIVPTADAALVSAQDADTVEAAEASLVQAETARDDAFTIISHAQTVVDGAVARAAEQTRNSARAERIGLARDRAVAAADNAVARLDTAHAEFAEWDDDPDGEPVRTALAQVASAASAAREAADAAVLAQSPEDAEQHASDAADGLAFALEALAEVARESTLADRNRADRAREEARTTEQAAAAVRAEAERVAHAQNAEAERREIAVEHAVASHAQVVALGASDGDLSDTQARAEHLLDAARSATSADAAERSASELEALVVAASEQVAALRLSAERAARQQRAQEHADRAHSAMRAAQDATGTLRTDSQVNVSGDAFTTAMTRVDSAMSLVEQAAQTAQAEADEAREHPAEAEFHETRASLAAARAEGASEAVFATIDAARDILRLGRQAAEQADAAPMRQRLDRAQSRAEVVLERADAIVGHARHSARGHDTASVLAALVPLDACYKRLTAHIDAAGATDVASESSVTDAENAAAEARTELVELEQVARGVHDAVRADGASKQAAAQGIGQAIERARAAAERARQTVSTLDETLRVENISAPGALDAFTDASRAAEDAADAAGAASRATTLADADAAAQNAADAADRTAAALAAADAAMAMELGGRDHDHAALTRVRAAAHKAAHAARVHAQQARRIAASVDSEARDDSRTVAQARTRVAELAGQVAFAAERADFASAEAEQTTNLGIAERARRAADDAASDAERTLTSLEDADDALADALVRGPGPAPAYEPPPQTSATLPTPQAAEPRTVTPLAPPPVAPAPRAPVVPPPVAKAAEPPARSAPPKKRGRKKWAVGGLFGMVGIGLLVLLIAAGIGGWFGYQHYASELPTVESLEGYEPPTVTTVYDYEGKLLGEIYEQRRYVTALDDMPEHVQHAFVSAEDKGFWEHSGVNWQGLVRATLANVTTGEKGQGASTITMQVTRNFLLTRDKTYERKIKEIILAQRIEGVYDKTHILYLYLNELYLGSGAYGVEAAARTYFGKHVDELSIAEAAMIAGLAPAPSTYSPHKNFDKAQVRQRYVLGRMLEDGHITQAEYDAAVAEPIVVVERTNEFLEMSPYFTEHVRRYIVETYGHDRVYNEGLSVTTTCDLDLQTLAQDAVRTGVDEVDQRMGFRRAGLEHISDSAIDARTASIEEELIAAQMQQADPAGRLQTPAKSTLVPEALYTGVLTEVQSSWARVRIGAHEGIIPIEWSRWVFAPNPRRSWRNRSQNDLTEQISWEIPGADEDAEPETRTGAILQVGDVVQVKVKALSTQDDAVASAFRRTPGESDALIAAHLWQTNEVEAALLSYDLETGAVRAMVGGSNFENSEFNRATQAYRQVGSTFKPIVYSAAIESRRVTAATMVTDGPLAFTTGDDFIWKPSNYSHSYLGNMTLRKALAMSRNTCTIRVLDRIDPGMNDDIVYDFVRRLGIGGPPKHALPDGWVPTPDNDWTCPWIPEKPDFTICSDRIPALAEGVTDRQHRATLSEDNETYMCRACDLSMGLGSRSLTMEELMRAYSTFGTGGKMIEPYYIEEVRDRDGNVLESHAPAEHVQVLDPAVASITTWLMESVVQGGTASRAGRLGLHLAGKTGTTNDEKDMWFIGFNPEVITAVWVGYDQPQSLGVSSTGGRTALPIWMDYMEVAVPKERDRAFRMSGNVEWAQIEEDTGRRVTAGGRAYPFLPGTVPESTGIRAGQVSIQDLETEL